MKISKFILSISIFPFLLNVNGQQLHENFEFKMAIDKNTRTRTGIPGDRYWQNESGYTIKADFNPRTGTVKGNVSIQYKNNSNDTLSDLVLKLMQNLYAKTGLRVDEVDTINLHSGIVIENVSINNEMVADSNITIKSTNLFIQLTDSMAPKTTSDVSMDFEIPLPRRTQLRTGAYDSTSYFIGYWFPQMAVYDDLFGWDMGNYMGNSEAYNDFSNYNVELTLPENFMVWATGELENKEGIFTTEILDKIEFSKGFSDSTIHIITRDDLKNKTIFKTKGPVTWKFNAENVPDFAWAASDHYLWDARAAKNPDSKNMCWVQAAYAADNKEFSLSTEVAKNSVEFFSTEFPGINYPYFKHISFNARSGGGMEFPMIANNGYSTDTFYVSLLTSHELAHNYFPFMMGINERKYGWFDEMMTTVMHNQFLNHLENGKYKEVANERNKRPAGMISGRNFDMPLITETETIVKKEAWLLNGYVKSLNMILSLETILGEAGFKNYLQNFMKTWAGKHPVPHDFFYSINTQSGKNLNWFWDKWVFSYAYPDLGVLVNQDDNTIEISNIGEQPMPFTLILNYKNDRIEEINFNAGVWENNVKINHVVKKVSKLKSIEVTCGFIPDIYPENNKIAF